MALVLVVVLASVSALVLVSEASTEENNRKFLQKVRLNFTKKLLISSNFKKKKKFAILISKVKNSFKAKLRTYLLDVMSFHVTIKCAIRSFLIKLVDRTFVRTITYDLKGS